MPRATARPPGIAVIDERACIGCALCIEACPVDAIVGAAKFMHTVIAGECTGCGWCLPPCPVDCISIEKRAQAWTHAERAQRADQYRRRHSARQARLERERLERSRGQTAEQKKHEVIERAMQRASERLQGRNRSPGKA
jgi:electron transport complex protein RnfB